MLFLRTVFRALTLLAVTRCELEGIAFGPDVLTPPFLADLVACLSFGKHGPSGAFDIAIKGYGIDVLVSQVANTTLKEPKVGKNIPVRVPPPLRPFAAAARTSFTAPRHVTSRTAA